VFNLFKMLVLGLVGVAALLLTGAVWVALDYGAAADATLRGPIMLYAFVSTLIISGFAYGVWRIVRNRFLRPLTSVANDIRTLIETKQLERGLRIPDEHELDGLPDALSMLVDELRSARRETVRAMASATARVEQEKGWLEVILLELIREGVIVCSSDHRILLYNQPAARLVRRHNVLGLGRSLFDVVAEEPVRHALERLSYRLQSGTRDLTTKFVCATRDAGMMLQMRIALMVDQAGKQSGYVLTAEDISAALTQLERSDSVRRTVTQDLREPIASLRAAAENLMSFQDIEADQRQTFYDIIVKQSTTLSDHLESLAGTYAVGPVGQWPMAEVHSLDLFKCVARFLHESAGIGLDVIGENRWLMSESHSLMRVLAYLVSKIKEQPNTSGFKFEAGIDDSKSFIELSWQGPLISDTTLGDWLEETVPGLAGITAAQVLEHHGGEPWSRRRGEQQAVLRIPLQSSTTAPAEADDKNLPPRPEFYDFDLMYAQPIDAEFGERPLKELTYVIFDTETTGLRPTSGDKIIEISAVRVTGGRVLTGETFDTLVDPERPIPKDSIRFHGITDDKVAGQPVIKDVLPRFHEFVGDAVLVAHNAAFDVKFLKINEKEAGISFDNPVLDTLLLSLLIEGDAEDHSLEGICERLHITIEDRHRALGDALATAHVLVVLLGRLANKNITTFGDLMQASDMEAALRFRSNFF
jgi:DNA polymerase-3 subunit epsilon